MRHKRALAALPSDEKADKNAWMWLINDQRGHRQWTPRGRGEQKEDGRPGREPGSSSSGSSGSSRSSGSSSSSSSSSSRTVFMRVQSEQDIVLYRPLKNTCHQERHGSQGCEKTVVWEVVLKRDQKRDPDFCVECYKWNREQGTWRQRDV